jgi:hypothetical protein
VCLVPPKRIGTGRPEAVTQGVFSLMLVAPGGNLATTSLGFGATFGNPNAQAMNATAASPTRKKLITLIKLLNPS